MAARGERDALKLEAAPEFMEYLEYLDYMESRTLSARLNAAA
jgi:hypothetical protein